MDAAQAISLVVGRIRSDRLQYPTQGLMAEAYDGGWCVYAPAVLEVENPMAVSTDVPRPSVFLVDDHSRSVEEVEDPDPESVAEACLWRAATGPAGQDHDASDLPSSPELWGPRRATAYDRKAIDALAQALTRERNFGGWLAWQLAALADLLGNSRSLIARRSGSSLSDHVKELADWWLEVSDGPSEVWRSWPAVDPATLPEADTTGWLLTAPDPLAGWLDTLPLEIQTPAVMQLLDTAFNQIQHAPRWRACGIVDYYPQLIPVRPSHQLSAALNEAQRLAHEHLDDEPAPDIRTLLLTQSPDDPDVEALLRLAIDAEHRRYDVIDLDAAAAAAYRRVLDRFGIVLDPGIEE